MNLAMVAFLSCIALCDYTVTLYVFSGVPNPTWKLSQSHFKDLMFLTHTRNKYLSTQLGYKGFSVQYKDEIFTVVGNQLAEQFLLSTIPMDMDHRVLSHCLERIHRGNVELDMTYEVKQVVRPQSKLEHVIIKGPDNVTAYDPNKWNKYPIQSENNCYNYANDIRTDTFAQPGRGTKQRWTQNSCANVGAAAVRDGLVFFTGDPLGDNEPDDGHFIALFMWDGVNFHWAKKDLETTWSHKPGQTAVRDHDNAGKTITDPAKADMTPYSTFCGYYVGIPSQVTVE